MRITIASLLAVLVAAPAAAGPVSECPVPADPGRRSIPVVDGIPAGDQTIGVYLSADGDADGATVRFALTNSAYAVVSAGPDGVSAYGRRTEHNALPRIAEFTASAGPGGAAVCVASPANGTGYQAP